MPSCGPGSGKSSGSRCSPEAPTFRIWGLGSRILGLGLRLSLGLGLMRWVKGLGFRV